MEATGEKKRIVNFRSCGSEMSYISIVSTNSENRRLFRCAEWFLFNLPVHSLCLEFFDFSDQTSLIPEALFHLKNKSDHIRTVNSFTNKIVNVQ